MTALILAAGSSHSHSVGNFGPRTPRRSMTQTTNRFFDEVARLMNDAAGVATGVKREFDTMFRTQAERWLRDLDLVKREEFEAVKEMKATARPKAGKGAARAERRAGRVPGVIYGDNKAPLTISLEHDELKERIYAGHFLTTIYELDVEGATHRVIPRDFQLDAVK